jgi:hypothetical protein
MSNIAEATEESVNYIQSIGLNARTIMGDVALRMEYMNRFNFEGGVLGLSKMAAQASMLRFDMNQTADFADKVLNPDGAIQMAAAFQRLGVASGDLVDPFILMDKSINDPEGLQDSIIDLAKQFTIFDEKTGNFRINPGGVRLLKELQEQTGLSYENMTKTALAAADMDRRLSQISFGIEGSEEDKMLVANMAKMGEQEGRKFEVEFIDDEGKKQTKALEDLTQAQFEQIKEQVRIAEEIVRQKELEKQVEKLFEDDEYLVLIPLTKESNQTYGSKTKWCTTMDYNGYWEKYSENYKFIFVLNKQTGEKIAISKGIYADEGVKVWDQMDNDVSIFDTGLASNIYEVVSKSLSITETNQEIYNRKFPKKNEYVSSYDDFMDFSFGNNRNDEEEEEIIPIGNGRSETYIDLLRRYMSNMGLSSEEYSWLRQRYGRNL